jgi:hypothetical protein
MFPFDEDFCVYDFDVDPNDEELCPFGPLTIPGGKKADKDATGQPHP